MMSMASRAAWMVTPEMRRCSQSVARIENQPPSLIVTPRIVMPVERTSPKALQPLPESFLCGSPVPSAPLPSSVPLPMMVTSLTLSPWSSASAQCEWP